MSDLLKQKHRPYLVGDKLTTCFDTQNRQYCKRETLRGTSMDNAAFLMYVWYFFSHQLKTI